MFEFKYKTVADFVKANGEAEALGCLKDGARQRYYRKMKNERDKQIRELIKNDSRFSDIVKNARDVVASDFGKRKVG